MGESKEPVASSCTMPPPPPPCTTPTAAAPPAYMVCGLPIDAIELVR